MFFKCIVLLASVVTLVSFTSEAGARPGYKCVVTDAAGNSYDLILISERSNKVLVGSLYLQLTEYAPNAPLELDFYESTLNSAQATLTESFAGGSPVGVIVPSLNIQIQIACPSRGGA